MDDLISRTEAVSIVKNALLAHFHGENNEEVQADCFSKWDEELLTINKEICTRMLTACVKRDDQPIEPKTGRWVPHPDPENREWDVCTACGIGCKRREYGTNPDGTEWEEEFNYPYCPNCGAKMERIDKRFAGTASTIERMTRII